jgi:hypothetical protein
LATRSAEPFICVLARLYCRRLFEAVRFGLRQEYVGRLCQKVFGQKGLDVDLQGDGSVHLAEEAATSRRTFLLKTDILLRKGRSPRVVVRVLTVDLARLESVPGEVEQAFGARYGA